jgi:membrane protease YdiL (CAAX protease family)
MSEPATTKTWRNQDWLWTVYLFSPWFVYPFLVILREAILGYRRFSFSWLDWLGGHARTSVFEPNNIALALAFILLYCAAYVILWVRGRSRLALVAIIFVVAATTYFGILYLDARFSPDAGDVCSNRDWGSSCVSYFELGLVMMASIVWSTAGCRWMFRRWASQAYSWDLPDKRDLKNAGPLSGVRQGSAWGLIAAAIRFIVFIGIVSLMIGIFSGLAQTIWKIPNTPAFDFALKMLAAFVGLTILLVAAIAAGRVVGGGNVNAGLANEPNLRSPLILLLAAILAGYAAIATYVLYRVRPDLLLEDHPIGSWQLVLFLLLVVVLFPVAEELFFRGWLWTGLRRHWSLLPTTSLTGGFWLVLHIDRGLLMIVLLPVAVILSLAREFAGSIRAPIALHAMYNSIAAGLVFLLAR